VDAHRTFEVVFFDLGGTLIDERDGPKWAEMGRELGLTLDEYHLLHAYTEVLRETDGPVRITMESLWGQVLDRASGEKVDPDLVRAFLDRGLKERSPARLFSDARRCLVQVRDQGRRLGVISNSRSEEHVRELLREARIEAFFEAVVSSGTERVAKPDPEIFRRAAARMRVDPAHAFHIGDLAFRDAKAARAAGFGSVWLNRDGWGFGEDPPEITSLTELPAYLEGLEEDLVGARVK
jgi:HAD superfamily hydrolase (TIGR01509 family)